MNIITLNIQPSSQYDGWIEDSGETLKFRSEDLIKIGIPQNKIDQIINLVTNGTTYKTGCFTFNIQINTVTKCLKLKKHATTF